MQNSLENVPSFIGNRKCILLLLLLLLISSSSSSTSSLNLQNFNRFPKDNGSYWPSDFYFFFKNIL